MHSSAVCATVVGCLLWTEIVITVSGPVAVVSSRWQGRGTYRGKRFVDDQRCGQVQIVTDSSASSE
jgi:hypothetical protein